MAVQETYVNFRQVYMATYASVLEGSFEPAVGLLWYLPCKCGPTTECLALLNDRRKDLLDLECMVESSQERLIRMPIRPFTAIHAASGAAGEELFLRPLVRLFLSYAMPPQMVSP
jgi:hypothetical protein